MRDIKRTVIKTTCTVVEFVNGEMKELDPVIVLLDDKDMESGKLMEKLRRAVAKKYPNRNTAISKQETVTETRRLSVENFMLYSEVVGSCSDCEDRETN